MAGWAAPVTADKIPGNGLAALASTTAPSTRSSFKGASTARASRIVEAPAAVAMSSPQAALMPTTMASEAVQPLLCRSSMRATLLAIIGVGVRVMISRIVRLALCISTSRPGPRGQVDRLLSALMEQLGMVSKFIIIYK